MVSIFGLSLFVGALLGSTFRVFVLIPAIAIMTLTVLAFGLARGEPISLLAIAALIAIVAVQIGYMIGSATTHFIKMARLTKRESHALRVANPRTH